MKSIKCSVIIPTFNRERTIKTALDYFRKNFFLDGEVIVVDDASQDETYILIEKNFPQVRLIKHPLNQGAAAARNTGIKASRGEYIAFLDSDDFWYPHKLSRQLSYFDTLNPSIAAVFSAYHYNKGKMHTRSFQLVESWFEFFLQGCFISPGSGLVVRRKIFEEIGFFDEKLTRFEDWDWLLRLSQKYDLDFINEPLFCVNYSGNPNMQSILDSVEILKNKWSNKLDKNSLSLFQSTLVMEKLSATRKCQRLFLRIFLLEALPTPRIILNLIFRALFGRSRPWRA